MPKYLLPRLGDVLFIALFIAVIGFGPRLLNVDGDLGRHLTIGAYILDSRSIPTQDVFSHTLAGQPLTPHEWLSQVIVALAYRVLGLNGVVWLCALLIAASFALVYRRAVRRSDRRGLALALVILAAAASSLHWLARPHLFTFLMLALWIDGLDRLWHGERVRWWSLPLIMLAWANLHGAFIAGFVTWAAYLAGWLWQLRFADPDRPVPPNLGRSLLLIGATSAAITLINPAGFELWSTSLGYVGNRYLVGHTAEYLPPDFHQAATWPFLLMIALSLMLIGAGRARTSMTSLLLIAGWTALGLYSVRNVPLYAIVAAPIIAESAAALGSNRWRRFEASLANAERPLRGHAWPVAAAVLVIALLTSGAPLDAARRGNHFDPSVFPVQAVDWLEQHPPPGRVFNYFTWGGYLLYRLWPDQVVFIDGQTDFYGEALTRRYEQVITLADGWADVLAQYAVEWVLMPVDSALVRELRSDPGWRIAYDDQTAIVLVRAP